MAVKLLFKDFTNYQLIDTVVTNDVPRIGEKLVLPADMSDESETVSIYRVVDVVHVYENSRPAIEYSHEVAVYIDIT